MSLKLGDTVPNFSQDSIEGALDFYAWAGSEWVILFSHPSLRRMGAPLMSAHRVSRAVPDRRHPPNRRDDGKA
jgi:hypothetical protein